MSLKNALRADRRGNALIREALKKGALTAGSTGAAVRAAERLLKIAGYDPGKIDGRFDARSLAALKTLDAATGSANDGAFDRSSFDALRTIQSRVRKHDGDTFLGVGQAGETVKAAEQRLRRLGYDVGAADGVFDGETAKAVKAFKRDEGIAGDSEFLGDRSTQQLRREVDGLAHAPYRGRVTLGREQHRRLDAATAQAAKSGIGEGASPRVVKNVQAHLESAGFSPGRVDGRFDGRTAAMVRQFQKKVGLPETGEVNARTWSELEKARFLARGGTSPAQSLGERSATVERSERILKQLGYRHVKVDGIFDAATQRASRAFERRFPGLGDDGRIGAGQLRRMKQVLHAKQHPGSGPLLKQGYRGHPVEQLQRRLDQLGFLHGAVDGRFGKQTARAVRRFQRAFHLKRDGVVGRQTWRMLGVDAKGKVNAPGAGGVGGVSGAGLEGLTPRVAWAAKVARKMGLVVTSTTGGVHAPTSYHYQGRAVDVAGPPSIMAKYYRYLSQFRPTELFYDPIGGIKNGVNIGAIGGHSDHVHVAF